MSQLAIRHYGSTFRYINRDPEQTTLLYKRQQKISGRAGSGSAGKTALREFLKGGLT